MLVLPYTYIHRVKTNIFPLFLQLYMEKRKKKTNISQFLATHTCIKLTFVSFFLLFFVHLSLNIRYEEKENIWYKTVWHNLWLVLTTRFDPKILKVGFQIFPTLASWSSQIMLAKENPQKLSQIEKSSQAACHLVTTCAYSIQSKSEKIWGFCPSV